MYIYIHVPREGGRVDVGHEEVAQLHRLARGPEGETTLHYTIIYYTLLYSILLYYTIIYYTML